MIDEQTKSAALAKLKHNMSIEMVAQEFDLPVQLIREWHSKLDPRDLLVLQSNIEAAEKVLHGDLIAGNEELLKVKLEDAAIAVTREIEMAASDNDVMRSKSLQLLSDALVKIHQSFIMKNNAGAVGVGALSQNGLSAFQRLMKD